MATDMQESIWWVCPNPNPNAALRLFCFPYAGAGAAIFKAWPERLSPAVEICAARLPGRGARLKESSFTDLVKLSQAIGEAITPYLDKPFAFFGHSMGAMISFELTRRLRRECLAQPRHLIVSGRRAPQIPYTDPPTYNLPEPEFIQELKRLNGTPKEILEHEELMQLVLPVLRSDFQVCQTYVPAPEAPLESSITAMGGRHDDEAIDGRLEAWKEQTLSSFTLHIMPGDHFYLQKFETLFFQILSQEIEEILRKIT
ncbi:MAG: alpha/beta fold hydrolase [Blastocatellia bacterium]|nr:alpha/beta fold hydrolase [Blastocatellia bacterium]